MHENACMYVCLKIYIRRALNEVTDAPQSQTNKNVFNARLKRSVDRSTERKEVGKLFQISDQATAKLRSPNVLLVRGTIDERRSDRRSKCAPAGVGDELAVVSKVSWQLTEQRLVDQQRQLELYTLPNRQPLQPTKNWRMEKVPRDVSQE